MTKEEKIKEAYGKNWEIVKDKVNKDGWIKDREFIFSEFIERIDWQTTDHDDEYYDTRRPVKLKGIENNNGWIKIESEEDLPKTNGMYWTIAKFNESCANTWGMLGKGEFTFDNGYVTHYQPIIKPNTPIY